MAVTFSTPHAPRASQSGIPIYADTRQLTRLAADLRAASPEAWSACRRALRVAGELVAEDARQRVGYSSRIEYTIKVRTGGRGIVKVVAGGEGAPDAAPIENRGRGFVRHPTFGHRDRFTAKNSHPAYLSPALDAHREEVLKIIEESVTGAVMGVIEGRFARL